MRLAPENQYIAAVLRSFLRQDGSVPSDLPPSGNLDWGRLLSTARYHKIQPVIHHELSKRGRLDSIPSSLSPGFEDESLHHIAYTLLCEACLRKVALAFERESVPYILIKGMSMACEFYRPRELRPYVDLDILIKSQDYNRAKAVLVDMGFVGPAPEKETHRRTHFNSVMFSSSGEQGVSIDLHWDTLMLSWNRRPLLGSDEVWQQVRYITFEDMKLPVLQPSRLFFFLCLHLSFHQFGALRTLCDMHLVMERFREDIDWSALRRHASEMRISRALTWPLTVARNLLGTEIPDGVSGSAGAAAFQNWLFPYNHLVFRSRGLSSMTERLVKFLLISGVRTRWDALAVFVRQRRDMKTGSQGSRGGRAKG